MATNYDTIWTTFLNKVKLSDIDLPTTTVKIHEAIHSAILSFNNRMRDSLDYDDSTETVSRELNNDDLLILAHFIRLDILNNQLIYFTNTWQPFAKDISLKNFSAQLKSQERLVEYQEKKIDELVVNQAVDFL
jgi:hypothetical protein